MKIHKKRFWEILRYAIGCALGIIVKTAVTMFAVKVLYTSDATGYLLAQVVILFFAFGYHSFITFGKRMHLLAEAVKAFAVFTVSVGGFKLLDYALFVIGKPYLADALEKSGMMTPLMNKLMIFITISAVSALIFFIKYFCYRFIFSAGPTEEKALRFTGSLKRTMTGHATDAELAANAASGGIAGGILLRLIEKKMIGGAFVSRMNMTRGKAEAETFIATTRDEILSAQGSIYFAFHPLSPENLEKARSFNGTLAFVLLPCQCAMLRRILEKDSQLREKTKLVIGLFCGHATEKDLLSAVLTKKGVQTDQLASFRFRKGLWRGNAEAKMKDGSVKTWPTADYNLYQNLFVSCRAYCMNCVDHYAEKADISCGDIWMLEHRKDSVKHSIFAIRTEEGEKAFNAAKDALAVHDSDGVTLFKANKRAAIFHKAINARRIAGRVFGIKIKAVPEAEKARLNEILAALMIMPLWKISRGKNFHLIMKTPRILLKVYLYAFKALTNF